MKTSSENLLRYNFKNPLEKNVLDEIVKRFDTTHSPANYHGFDKYPSDFETRYNELNIIMGKIPSLENQLELLRYPDSREYLEVKGITSKKDKKVKTETSAKEIVENTLNSYEIKYKLELSKI